MVLKMAMRHGDSLAARRPLRTVAVAGYSHVEAGPSLSTIDTRRSAAPRPLGGGHMGVRGAGPGPGKLPACCRSRPAPRTKAVPAPAGERGARGLDSAQTRAGSAAWQKQTTAITALQAAVRLACQREIDMSGQIRRYCNIGNYRYSHETGQEGRERECEERKKCISEGAGW